MRVARLPSPEQQRRIIREAALSQNLRPRILWGLYGAETDFGKNVQSSSAGAQGPFQFMPDTAAGMGIDPQDFREAAFGAAKYLAQYKGRGRRGMLAAYNAGPAGNPNNPETAAYVPKVLRLAKTWNPPGGSSGAPGGAPGAAGGTGTLPGTSGPRSMPQGSEGLTALLASLTEKPQVQSAGLQGPAFSAAAAMPGGYQAPASGGGPVQRPSVTSLLEAARTTGGGIDRAALPQVAASALAQGVPNAQPGVRNGAVAALKSEMRHINDAKVPYQWGGGHAAPQARGSKVTPLDCSGAVSRALGINPRVSGEFEQWGKSGRGKRVTVYANGEHVLMEVDGRFWGTSKSNPGGGAGWIPRKQISTEYLSRFTARHPRGM